MPPLYSKYAICRVGSGGHLDPTFNRDGIVLTDFVNSLTEGINSLAIDDRDRIVVGGWISTTSTETSSLLQKRVFAVARYLVSGTLDRAFGQADVAVRSLPSSWLERWRSWGFRRPSPFRWSFRWNPSRVPPTSGVVLTNFSDPWGESINAVTIDRASRIIAAGYAAGKDIALARYTMAGALDQTFGTRGLVTTDISSGVDAALSLVVDTQGRLLVGGTTEINDAYAFVVVRYTDDGLVDQSFGDQGVVTTDLGGSGVAELALDSSQRILAGGYLPNDFVITRYDRDGSLDSSFGIRGPSTGSTRVEVPNGIMNALAVDRADRVVVGGSSGGSHVLARFDDRGQLDSSFGNGGLAKEDFSGLSTGSHVAGRAGVNGLRVDDRGRILTVGSAGNVGVVARFEEDGSLDRSFGTNGGCAVSPYGMAFTHLTDLAIDSHGRIVAAGSAFN